MENTSNTLRIRTNVGESDSPKVIHVNLEQTYDMFEILSLKIGQTNSYRTFESDYGVIVGRVIANDGLGVENAKISIFIPVSNDEDERRRLLYNFTNTSDEDSDGIRYNILPRELDDLCHQPVGTFPDKQYVLDNKNVLEVFDKYWKYTTRTNKSGDYMLFGIPTGEQMLHVDIDLSDCGLLSQRPHNMIAKGYNINQFESPNKFRTSTNLSSLPQIITENRAINVYPYWGDTSEGQGSNLNITRCDFNIAYKFETSCVFMGSVITDKASNTIAKDCSSTPNAGKMSELVTGEGTIEMIRKTPNNKVESYAIEGNRLIDSNGVWCYEIPMNLDYIRTDEFGNTIPTDDPSKGVATRARVRFRITMDETENDVQSVKRARFLIPNNPRLEDEEYGKTHEADYEFGTMTRDESFVDLLWNKVYTVKSYIPKTGKKGKFTNEKKFNTGIKNIKYFGDNNPMPYNNLTIKMTFNYRLNCLLSRVFIQLVTFINQLISTLAIPFCEISNICKKIYKACKRTYVLKVLGTPFKLLSELFEAAVPSCMKIDRGFCDDGINRVTYYPGCGRILGSSKQIHSGANCAWNKTLRNHIANEKAEFPKKKDYDENRTEASYQVSELYNCIENQLANDNEITSYNFDNDWVNGVLYFPQWQRVIRPKKRYFFGIFSKKAADNWCSSDVNVDKYMIAKFCACTKGKDNAVAKTYDNLYGESITPVITKKNVDNSNDETSALPLGVGVIHSKVNMVGQTLYYYRAVNYDPNIIHQDNNENGDAVLLFATDVVLLGSLDTFDDDGIPQFFRMLTPSTYHMPTDVLASDFEPKMVVTKTGQVVQDSNALERHSEAAGADWGNANEYGEFDGGLFFGITCSKYDMKTKSCVNLERICEYGVRLDQTQDYRVVKNGSIDEKKTIVTDGYVSFDELEDVDGRSMFATLNSNRLKTILDNETGLKKYDIFYLYPDVFNGDLYHVMKEKQSPLGSTVSYKNNYMLETFSRDYYMFRYGQRPCFYNTEKEQNNRFARYENSFYFYFGLKEGKTAIEKFNSTFYAPCNNEADINNGIVFDVVPNTWESELFQEGGGGVRFDLGDVSTPFTFLLNSRDNTDFSWERLVTPIETNKFYIGKWNWSDSPEDMGYSEQGEIDDKRSTYLANGTYDAEIVDAEGNITDFVFKMKAQMIEYETNVVNFKFNNDHFAQESKSMSNISEDQDGLNVYGTTATRRIGGLIVVHSVSVEHFTIRIEPQTPYGDYNGIEVNSDSEPTNSFLKQVNGTFVFGVPFGDGKYTITVTEDIIRNDYRYATKNRKVTVVSVPQPVPFKMYINDVDYALIKDFNGEVYDNFTGWTETLGDDIQLYDQGYVNNDGNPWLHLDDIYVLPEQSNVQKVEEIKYSVNDKNEISFYYDTVISEHDFKSEMKIVRLDDFVFNYENEDGLKPYDNNGILKPIHKEITSDMARTKFIDYTSVIAGNSVIDEKWFPVLKITKIGDEYKLYCDVEEVGGYPRLVKSGDNKTTSINNLMLFWPTLFKKYKTFFNETIDGKLTAMQKVGKHRNFYPVVPMVNVIEESVAHGMLEETPVLPDKQFTERAFEKLQAQINYRDGIYHFKNVRTLPKRLYYHTLHFNSYNLSRYYILDYDRFYYEKSGVLYKENRNNTSTGWFCDAKRATYQYRKTYNRWFVLCDTSDVIYTRNEDLDILSCRNKDEIPTYYRTATVNGETKLYIDNGVGNICYWIVCDQLCGIVDTSIITNYKYGLCFMDEGEYCLWANKDNKRIVTYKNKNDEVDWSYEVVNNTMNVVSCGYIDSSSIHGITGYEVVCDSSSYKLGKFYKGEYPSMQMFGKYYIPILCDSEIGNEIDTNLFYVNIYDHDDFGEQIDGYKIVVNSGNVQQPIVGVNSQFADGKYEYYLTGDTELNGGVECGLLSGVKLIVDDEITEHQISDKDITTYYDKDGKWQVLSLSAILGNENINDYSHGYVDIRGYSSVLTPGITCDAEHEWSAVNYEDAKHKCDTKWGEYVDVACDTYSGVVYSLSNVAEFKCDVYYHMGDQVNYCGVIYTYTSTYSGSGHTPQGGYNDGFWQATTMSGSSEVVNFNDYGRDVINYRLLDIDNDSFEQYKEITYDLTTKNELYVYWCDTKDTENPQPAVFTYGTPQLTLNINNRNVMTFSLCGFVKPHEGTDGICYLEWYRENPDNTFFNTLLTQVQSLNGMQNIRQKLKETSEWSFYSLNKDGDKTEITCVVFNDLTVSVKTNEAMDKYYPRVFGLELASERFPSNDYNYVWTKAENGCKWEAVKSQNNSGESGTADANGGNLFVYDQYKYDKDAGKNVLLGTHSVGISNVTTDVIKVHVMDDENYVYSSDDDVVNNTVVKSVLRKYIPTTKPDLDEKQLYQYSPVKKDFAATDVYFRYIEDGMMISDYGKLNNSFDNTYVIGGMVGGLRYWDSDTVEDPYKEEKDTKQIYKGEIDVYDVPVNGCLYDICGGLNINGTDRPRHVVQTVNVNAFLVKSESTTDRCGTLPDYVGCVVQDKKMMVNKDKTIVYTLENETGTTYTWKLVGSTSGGVGSDTVLYNNIHYTLNNSGYYVPNTSLGIVTDSVTGYTYSGMPTNGDILKWTNENDPGYITNEVGGEFLFCCTENVYNCNEGRGKCCVLKLEQDFGKYILSVMERLTDKHTFMTPSCEEISGTIYRVIYGNDVFNEYATQNSGIKHIKTQTEYIFENSDCNSGFVWEEDLYYIESDDLSTRSIGLMDKTCGNIYMSNIPVFYGEENKYLSDVIYLSRVIKSDNNVLKYKLDKDYYVWNKEETPADDKYIVVSDSPQSDDYTKIDVGSELSQAYPLYSTTIRCITVNVREENGMVGFVETTRENDQNDHVYWEKCGTNICIKSSKIVNLSDVNKTDGRYQWSCDKPYKIQNINSVWTGYYIVFNNSGSVDVEPRIICGVSASAIINPVVFDISGDVLDEEWDVIWAARDDLPQCTFLKKDYVFTPVAYLTCDGQNPHYYNMLYSASGLNYIDYGTFRYKDGEQYFMKYVPSAEDYQNNLSKELYNCYKKQRHVTTTVISTPQVSEITDEFVMCEYYSQDPEAGGYYLDHFWVNDKSFNFMNIVCKDDGAGHDVYIGLKPALVGEYKDFPYNGIINCNTTYYTNTVFNVGDYVLVKDNVGTKFAVVDECKQATEVNIEIGSSEVSGIVTGEKVYEVQFRDVSGVSNFNISNNYRFMEGYGYMSNKNNMSESSAYNKAYYDFLNKPQYIQVTIIPGREVFGYDDGAVDTIRQITSATKYEPSEFVYGYYDTQVFKWLGGDAYTKITLDDLGKSVKTVPNITYTDVNGDTQALLYKDWLSMYRQNGFNDIIVHNNIKYETIQNEWVNPSPEVSRTHYKWGFNENYHANEYVGVKEEELTTENVNGFVRRINDIIRNRRQIPSVMRDAFMIDGKYKDVNISFTSNAIPVGYTLYQHVEKEVQNPDNSVGIELDVNNGGKKSNNLWRMEPTEHFVDNVTIPNITYISDDEGYHTVVGADINDTWKQPFYVGIANVDREILPYTEVNNIVTTDDGVVVNNNPLSDLFKFPMIDYRPNISGVVLSSTYNYSGFGQADYNIDWKNKPGLLELTMINPVIDYEGNISASINGVDVTYTKLCDTNCYADRYMVDGYDENQMLKLVGKYSRNMFVETVDVSITCIKTDIPDSQSGITTQYSKYGTTTVPQLTYQESTQKSTYYKFRGTYHGRYQGVGIGLNIYETEPQNEFIGERRSNVATVYYKLIKDQYLDEFSIGELLDSSKIVIEYQGEKVVFKNNSGIKQTYRTDGGLLCEVIMPEYLVGVENNNGKFETQYLLQGGLFEHNTSGRGKYWGDRKLGELKINNKVNALNPWSDYHIEYVDYQNNHIASATLPLFNFMNQFEMEGVELFFDPMENVAVSYSEETDNNQLSITFGNNDTTENNNVVETVYVYPNIKLEPEGTSDGNNTNETSDGNNTNETSDGNNTNETSDGNTNETSDGNTNETSEENNINETYPYLLANEKATKSKIYDEFLKGVYPSAECVYGYSLKESVNNEGSVIETKILTGGNYAPVSMDDEHTARFNIVLGDGQTFEKAFWFIKETKYLDYPLFKKIYISDYIKFDNITAPQLYNVVFHLVLTANENVKLLAVIENLTEINLTGNANVTYPPGRTAPEFAGDGEQENVAGDSEQANVVCGTIPDETELTFDNSETNTNNSPGNTGNTETPSSSQQNSSPSYKNFSLKVGKKTETEFKTQVFADITGITCYGWIGGIGGGDTEVNVHPVYGVALLDLDYDWNQAALLPSALETGNTYNNLYGGIYYNENNTNETSEGNNTNETSDGNTNETSDGNNANNGTNNGENNVANNVELRVSPLPRKGYWHDDPNKRQDNRWLGTRKLRWRYIELDYPSDWDNKNGYYIAKITNNNVKGALYVTSISKEKIPGRTVVGICWNEDDCDRTLIFYPRDTDGKNVKIQMDNNYQVVKQDMSYRNPLSLKIKRRTWDVYTKISLS